MTKTIHARHALLPEGWARSVTVSIDETGHIASVNRDGDRAEHTVGILLPALSNLHSHSFQRAMAGLAERRGPGGQDDFWTWRSVMYRFLDILTPDDIGVIAAQVQKEMLEAGYAAQAEFHYVHHAPGGEAYEQIAETSLRHFEAARLTGIGYTHLPVLYMQGGLDGQELTGGQLRFGCDLDRFGALYEAIGSGLADMPEDCRLGIAPHSLRAVTKDGLQEAVRLAPEGPIHIHVAEQTSEVEAVLAAYGARPARWLMDQYPIDDRWCFIHATHLDQGEISDLAHSGAVAGLCPMTEANLGDGIFPADQFLSNGGAFGIGSDSNVRIALSEELRLLETSQRLRDRKRLILSDAETPSNGQSIYEKAALGGARALNRPSGEILPGCYADLVALDDSHIALAGLTGDTILDTWIFACSDDVISDVWSAGRHMVTHGHHVRHEEIERAFRTLIVRLRAML